MPSPPAGKGGLGAWNAAECNRRMSKRVNATGRPKQIKAPADKLLKRDCPHLALVDTARYDLLIGKLSQDNAHYGRKDTGPRPSKKYSRWPGKHIFCEKPMATDAPGVRIRLLTRL